MNWVKIGKFLTGVTVSLTAFLQNPSAHAAWRQQGEMSPQMVIEEMYKGLQHIHNYENTPKLNWGVRRGTLGGCGLIKGSHYCTLNHTIYITENHINMAYEHGDAALAYIVSHEYAHAMQFSFGFMPNNVPVAELQADCLAGVYFGAIPNIEFDRSDILEAATFAHRVGDFHFSSAQHHGTPDQRATAISHGIQASFSNSSTSFQACLQ